MIFKKKATTFLVMTTLVVAGTAATIMPKHQFRNLKVLPQDIGERQLDSIMDSYNRALKVNCDFCHSAPKANFPLTPVNNDIDFALDNEMKEEARRMMRMTISINKTYFNQDSTRKPELLNVVSCNTCHRGNPFPAHE